MKYHFLSIWLAKIKMCHSTKGWICVPRKSLALFNKEYNRCNHSEVWCYFELFINMPSILEIPSQDFVLRENLANRQEETSIKCFQEQYPQQQKPGSHLKATRGVGGVGWRWWQERDMNKLCNCHAKE